MARKRSRLVAEVVVKEEAVAETEEVAVEIAEVVVVKERAAEDIELLKLLS